MRARATVPHPPAGHAVQGTKTLGWGLHLVVQTVGPVGVFRIESGIKQRIGISLDRFTCLLVLVLPVPTVFDDENSAASGALPRKAAKQRVDLPLQEVLPSDTSHERIIAGRTLHFTVLLAVMSY